MVVTRSFKQLVQKHVTQDAAFAEALLREGIDLMLAGDVDTGKAILRDYIKATVGFEKLGRATGTQPKSLIRMFGPRGNPQATESLQRHSVPSKTGWRRIARCAFSSLTARAPRGKVG